MNDQLNQSESLKNLGGEFEILESFLPPLNSPRNTDENRMSSRSTELGSYNWNNNYG